MVDTEGIKEGMLREFVERLVRNLHQNVAEHFNAAAVVILHCPGRRRERLRQHKAIRMGRNVHSTFDVRGVAVGDG